MTDHSISTDLLPCPLCKKPPGSKVGPPAMVRCVTDGCEGKKLGANTVADWNRRALTTASDAVADERLDSVTIEACAKIAEGTAPIAAGNFFAARRDQCAIIATKIRALKIADERAKELATLAIPSTADAEAEWERLNLAFHEALRLYPDSWAALHHLWNNTIAGPVRTTQTAPDWKQDQAETSRLAGEEQS